LLESAITPRTRAIIPVHIYGHPAAMAPINTIAEAHGLRVIEDCAQAHMAGYHGRPVGSLGDCGVFSFYVSKNLGGYGEGGMITTNDDELAEKMRLLRNHGYASKYEHLLIGYNSRLDEIQAAILRTKLGKLAWGNQRRRELAAVYDEALADLPLITPAVAPQVEHVYHLYTVRTPDREALAAHLAANDIGFATHYRVPAHVQPACRPYGLSLVSLPETEAAASEVLQLPMHPYLSDEQIAHVAATVRQFFA
jgi:dTDP-4-amino-4,6-dideoxygalactose transaminase